MKLFDKVQVIVDKEKYQKYYVCKNMIGRIWSAEIRDNCFLVQFIDQRFWDKNFTWTEDNMTSMKDDIYIPIKISDLEIIEEENTSDETLLKDLPLNNPKWWCKVEGGYILNLLGEKKNKIPYDYNS